MKKILYTAIMLFCLSSCTIESNKEKESSIEDGVLLRYNLNEGDEFLLEVDVDINMEKEALEMKMGMSVTTSVNNTKSNSINVNSIYNKLTMEIDMEGESEKYDSENPEASDFSTAMHDMIGSMIGIKLNHEFTSNGEMISTPDYESLFTNPQMKMQMDGFNDQLDNMIIELPEDTLFIGEYWEEEIIADGITSNVKYTLTDITNQEYIFELNSKITGSGMNGTQTGELILDKNTCMINSSYSTLNMPAIGMEASYKYTGKKIR